MILTTWRAHARRGIAAIVVCWPSIAVSQAAAGTVNCAPALRLADSAIVVLGRSQGYVREWSEGRWAVVRSTDTLRARISGAHCGERDTLFLKDADRAFAIDMVVLPTVPPTLYKPVPFVFASSKADILAVVRLKSGAIAAVGSAPNVGDSLAAWQAAEDIVAERLAKEADRRDAEEAKRERAKVVAKAAQDAAVRRQRLSALGWPREFLDAVLRGRVSIGMTDKMVREAWGPPGKINRTIRASGVSEQWVYESAYLYFENGKLTTIQDSR